MKNFKDRLKELIEKEGLTASKFAEKIGIQRSSVSHILSGRNKPSLDFVIKINIAFDDVSLDWLINGSNEIKTDVENSFPSPPSQLDLKKNLIRDKNIKEIGFFYNDGSFKIFKN
ncbi:MAG: helix-turn-helix domain-containing protein [Flavobacteriales bacterium]|jgi:transcriptional regulator with XRE-family HTH domain|tara:strand:+ start:2191 stop:2535 length:345 start_codon:yes stop_codon:yes gene_type:complete